MTGDVSLTADFDSDSITGEMSMNSGAFTTGDLPIDTTISGDRFTEFSNGADNGVIPPFLAGCIRRIHATIFSFWAGVMPPMPMFGRSLLYVQSHCVAKSWASSMVSMMYWSNHSCRTVRL